MAIDRSQDGTHQPIERLGIRPADFDLEDLDPGAQGGRHPYDILCCRDEPSAGAFGIPLQGVDLCGPERMVIGKLRHPDEIGTEGSHGCKELLRPPDPGEGEKARAS